MFRLTYRFLQTSFSIQKIKRKKFWNNVKYSNQIHPLFFSNIGPFLLILVVLLGLVGCRLDSVTLPVEFEESTQKPKIYPDYSDILIPPNIAPLNFVIEETGDQFVVQISSNNGTSQTFKGPKIDIPLRFWKSLLNEPNISNINIDVFVRQKEQWTKFAPVIQTISNDPIDSWVSYRLIEPGYEFYHRLGLYQRNLETFDETAFFRNEPVHLTTCVNCHSFQNRKTDNFMFHTRNGFGGTTIVQNGKAVKIDTKCEELISACTYPAWHPNEPFIAFSVNKTFQFFHSKSLQKIEVLDSYSDLVLFDVETRTIRPIFKTPHIFETFPSWSQDGLSLYYCAAELKLNHPFGSEERILELKESYQNLKYNLMRISFDPQTRQFGEPEKVVDAAKMDKSIVHPRSSPDGRFLLFTLANFGTFPIWHSESDLWILDQETGETRILSEVNSERAESWHTWDSSGRWFVFSSRRDDGLFTRLYFTHFENGQASKPFLLPQRDPYQNLERMKSYNIPEMMIEPVDVKMPELIRAIKIETPLKANYKAGLK
ncbi:MAG: hypothetical protein Q4C95_02880 [Planctomycetia bacterium]|nr:hypothetical protein [Planctomycetia bacterium]